MANTLRTTVLIANPSPDVYGSDLQMLESIAAMRTEGWRVVVALPSDGELVPRLHNVGAEVEFVSFPVLRRANASTKTFFAMALAAIRALPRIRKFIKGVRPSVVYVNTVTLPWWLVAARSTKTPTVCHLHEAETEDRLMIRKALISPLRFATAIIVISQSALRAMCDVVPSLQKSAHLIYNGVPGPPRPPSEARRSDPWRLLVIGRLSPRKAPHLALEAAAKLRREGRIVEIELAGSAFEGYEWYVQQLEDRASEPDLNGSVYFSGYSSPIWPALARSDILVAPSLREPFGNAVVEAQLARRPVVATAALGHLESISDLQTGLLFPAGDVDALSDGICRLMDDNALAHRLTVNAESSAVERFSTERYSRQITSLIRDLVMVKEGVRS